MLCYVVILFVSFSLCLFYARLVTMVVDEISQHRQGACWICESVDYNLIHVKCFQSAVGCEVVISFIQFNIYFSMKHGLGGGPLEKR